MSKTHNLDQWQCYVIPTSVSLYLRHWKFLSYGSVTYIANNNILDAWMTLGIAAYRWCSRHHESFTKHDFNFRAVYTEIFIHLLNIWLMFLISLNKIDDFIILTFVNFFFSPLFYFHLTPLLISAFSPTLTCLSFFTLLLSITHVVFLLSLPLSNLFLSKVSGDVRTGVVHRPPDLPVYQHTPPPSP